MSGSPVSKRQNSQGTIKFLNIVNFTGSIFRKSEIEKKFDYFFFKTFACLLRTKKTENLFGFIV